MYFNLFTNYTSYLVLKVLVEVLPLLIATAFFTVLERKVIGAMQRRIGPNIIGFWGILQPFADALKLILKEFIFPTLSNRNLFFLAPIIIFTLSLALWLPLPLTPINGSFSDLNAGILFIFAISSLNVYGIILAGWASNSKYALLGALRSAAQMISYEVSLGIIVISVLLITGSLNLRVIISSQENLWFIIPLLPASCLFFISILAETNRHPFDLPEAEAELVAGYNVEYSAMGFALFFLGEYTSILLMSGLFVLLFLGGWLPLINTVLFNYFSFSFWYALKIFFCIFLFIWIRATTPRYRYDQLMSIGWKTLLPLALAWLCFQTMGLLVCGLLPF